MTLSDLDLTGLRYRTSAEVFEDLQSACDSNPDLAAFEVIGESEEGDDGSEERRHRAAGGMGGAAAAPRVGHA